MIDINIDLARLQAELTALARRLGDLGPVLRPIGEELVDSTKRRFDLGQGPDGRLWEPNSPATLARFTHRVKGTMTKDRRLPTKKGEARWDSKKPLVDSGTLQEQIHYDVQGNTLFVGSSMEYAAMQQFGGAKAEFPHLWGDIPPRPFLGLSLDDEAMIRRELSHWLEP